MSVCTAKVRHSYYLTKMVVFLTLMDRTPLEPSKYVRDRGSPSL